MKEEEKLLDYLRGGSLRGWEIFGAHPELNGTSFAVYAPAAAAVSLICSAHNWQPLPMERDQYGVWRLYLEGNLEGAMYKYRVTTAAGEIHDRMDPYAFCCERRPNTASIVTRLEGYQWGDEAWLSRRSRCHDRPMNIYEVHAGSWRRNPPAADDPKGENNFYSYHQLAEELVPYLQEMGYTHLELMPLMEHPLDASWGYQVTGYFAPTSRYGSPKELMELVDRCHQAGIGVLLDFVPLHFVRDFYALHLYDGSCLYEPDREEERYTQWGTALFDFTKPHVLSFVKSALDFWLSVYHFDGIRYDAVANLVYRDGNPDRGVNEPGVWFLKNANFALHQAHCCAILIAEDSSTYPKVTAPVEYGGLGFDYKWAMGWMHDTLDYLALPFEYRSDSHNKLTFAMSYFHSENFLLPFSHDEVVHGKRTIIDKIWGIFEEKFAQLKSLYLFMFTHPGKKLNFMGNDLGEFKEWDESKALGWNLLQYPAHDCFHRYLRQLHHLYCREPALWKADYHPQGFRWLDVDNRSQSVFAYERWDLADSHLAAVFNFSEHLWEGYMLRGLPPLAVCTVLLNTDALELGGSGREIPAVLQADDHGQVKLDLAPFAGMLLRVEEPEADQPEDEPQHPQNTSL